MKNLSRDLDEIFHRLKKCHEILSRIRKYKKNKKEMVRPLFESLALCSGAFFHLIQYQKLNGEQIKTPKIMPVHQDSWNIFLKVNTLEEISQKYEKREEIEAELCTMAIADATVRIYSASALIFNERKKYSKASENQVILKKICWPFQDDFLKGSCDWDRGVIFKEFQKHKEQNSPQQIPEINPNLCFLLFIIAFRDEYSHSEYYENCEKKIGGKDMREYLEKRHGIIEFPHSQERILEANIAFLKIILDNIQQISHRIIDGVDLESGV
jgi:hypothetical protein